MVKHNYQLIHFQCVIKVKIPTCISAPITRRAGSFDAIVPFCWIVSLYGLILGATILSWFEVLAEVSERPTQTWCKKKKKRERKDPEAEENELIC
jgi:hypothetical protein